MIKEPFYDKKIQKWVVDCGEHLHYFGDGETADDFYLINRAQKNETKNSRHQSETNE
jgi:hypothetical protein